jgi:large subunit ribosomal protein L10
MPTAEKAQTIDQAKQWYDKSIGIVFTDYKGLSVKEVQQLRSQVRKKGGDIHVIKNTLFRLAAGQEIVDSLPNEFHNGTTAFAFVYENEPDVAKTLVDYARTSKKLIIKGAYLGGQSYTSKQVEALSALPPRDVLIAQVIGAISSPLSSLIGTIEALYADPIRVIGAVADKVAESSPPAVSAAPSAAPVTSEPVAMPDSPAEVESAPESTVTEEAPAEEVAAQAATEDSSTASTTEGPATAETSPTEDAAPAESPAEEIPASEEPAVEASAE